MNSKQNTNRQKQKKNVSKSIFTARSERSDVEIQKHFNPTKSSRGEINKGVDSFPIVGDIESKTEVSVNIDKQNKKTKKTFHVNNPTEISLDVFLPPSEIDANIEYFDSNNEFNTCTSLNKKVEDINKQLAELEKDIQFNFYDPKTKVGSNLKKYSSQLQSFSSSKNPSNTTTSTASDYGNLNKFNNAPKQSDACIELKNEIYSYRSSLKQKNFEEKIEKRLEKLHKQKEESELRKNETKGEAGHEPTCPLSLKLDLPEPVLKIHEMQLTAKRLKIAEGGALNSTQNASSSQTSPQKADQTTIQNNDQEEQEQQKPSTSKENNSANNENNMQISISDVNVEVVRQLNSLLKKSTSELDELKVLLKKYLKTENNNKSPRNDKNVKFTLTDQNDVNTNTRKKPLTPSRSSSNSDISLTSLNFGSRKKLTREPRSRQTVDIEKKSKIIKIKQISKSTKTKKCDLSDISESNEIERNSSSTDIIRSKPSSVKKQTKTYSKKEPSTCKEICKPSSNDQQTELILNIISKSSSSLLSTDDDKRTHIRDFIDKLPKDSNDLTNPPNTVRLAPPEKIANSKSTELKKDMAKKKSLEVQILPPLDIRRSLITQKLPDVAIESIDDHLVDSDKKVSSENVKYIEITHGNDIDLPKEETPKEETPKEETSEIVKPADEVKSEPDILVPIQSNKDDTCSKDCDKKEISLTKSKTTDIKIKEIYIARQQVLSSSDDISRDDIVNERPPSATRKKIKNISEERRTVSEELNLDIDSLPSVRTLKEIQTYLEQKCALIRSRLQEESKLKTGETLSLRYKLSQPPLWQSSSATAETETEVEAKAEPENKYIPEQNPKPITLSPLKTYSSIKTPLSPLQKHDKSQQIKNNPSLISTPNPKLTKTTVKTVDKSLQVSISENLELPVARKDNACCSPQFSIETSNKDIHEIREDFSTPSISLKLPKTVERNEYSESIRQITVSTQKDNFQVICLSCKDAAINTDLLEEINNTQLVPPEDQETNKSSKDINKFSHVSTQINEYDRAKHAAKHVSFEIVTTQFSLSPKENKETQISQLDLKLDEKISKPPIETKQNESKVVEKIEKVEKKQCKNEKTQTIINEIPMIKEKEAQVVRYIQSNATQTVNVKDKFTICNMPKVNGKEEKVHVKPSSANKETKECCTQYSPPVVQLQDLDATEYKTFNSFRNVDRFENDEQNKHVHYPPEERRQYYKSNMRNKRVLQRYKVCSTPVSPSSISTNETVSISDGEVKLSCECSTSIGEIHLCRFANNIRKKVRILKQNPKEVLKESFGGTNFQMERQHKYNDNWFAYYVSKTESSSEQGTGSNLSSIKSNIETE